VTRPGTAMKRPQAHQINELAKRVLNDSLPPTWVLNEHHNDYGKDYLVEIGHDNGDLTGTSFYVQLKGHKKANLTADGTQVKHSLESKYAEYYSERIRDLPVFLIVVDVARKKGWWLFLQPMLDIDQSWRQQSNFTVSIPCGNTLAQPDDLRRAVDEAKKWMRLHHPESIHETVVAHKERIARTDPRFDVKVSLTDDRPAFALVPKEPVSLQLHFQGQPDVIREKVNRLFEKGHVVAFEAGEVKITGSDLFGRAEEVGCQMQVAVTLEANLSLAAVDAGGTEVGRLNDISGQFRGGQMELWFEGRLAQSPLSIKFGPVAPQVGGSFSIKIEPQRWNGQRILQLAYFDRLCNFFKALPAAKSLKAECENYGNVVFSTAMTLHEQPYAIPFARYLETLEKGRAICKRFDVNPVWTVETFDRDAQETFEELAAILFHDGSVKSMPNLKVTMKCVRDSCAPHLLLDSKKPEHFMYVSTVTYSFMGQNVEVGRLIHEFKEVLTRVHDAASRNRNIASKPAKKPRRRVRGGSVDLALLGTPNTVVSVRLATPEEG
jgi:hypothetical protein